MSYDDFMAQHGGLVASLLRPYLRRRPDLTDDLTQAAAVGVLEGLASFSSAPPSVALTTHVANAVRSSLNATIRPELMAAERCDSLEDQLERKGERAEALERPDEAPLSDEQVRQFRVAGELPLLLASLNPSQRTAVRMRWMDDEPATLWQVGAALGCNVWQARNVLRNAAKRLRRAARFAGLLND